MIHRAEHKEEFTRVLNALIKDGRLSLEARGLLLFMLSLPSSWEFSIGGIAHALEISENTVMRLVKELKTCGYIRQDKKKNNRGQFTSYEWHIYESPELGKNRTSGKPNSGRTELRENQTLDAPNFGKSRVIETNNIDKRLIDINDYKSNKSVDEFSKILEPLPSEIRDVFKEFIAMRKKVKAPLTSHALELAIKRAYELGGNNTERIVAVVNQSIMNSWKGLFELKEEKVQPITQQPKYGFDPNEALAWAREQDRKKAEGNL